MTIIRHYSHDRDYDRIGRFLVETYGAGAAHINWLQPRWEYMHYHPMIWEVDCSTIGVWEERGKIVGTVHPEHPMGEAYFEIHPDYGNLRREMLEYAEEVTSQ
jgi:hypothetical protein